MAHGFDLKPDDTLYWITDMGWMMGPWEVLGALLLGASHAALRRRAGLPGRRPAVGAGRAAPRHRPRRLAHPDPRADARTARSRCARHDLSSLRWFGSTG